MSDSNEAFMDRKAYELAVEGLLHCYQEMVSTSGDLTRANHDFEKLTGISPDPFSGRVTAESVKLGIADRSGLFPADIDS